MFNTQELNDIIERDHLSEIKINEIYDPVNPLLIKPKPISLDHLGSLWYEWCTLLETSIFPVYNMKCEWDIYGIRYSVYNGVRRLLGANLGGEIVEYVYINLYGQIFNPVYDRCKRELIDPKKFESLFKGVKDGIDSAIYAYISGLFIPYIDYNIVVKQLGTNPWEPLLKLWYSGYVPSIYKQIDETKYSYFIHFGNDAEIVNAETIKGIV